MRESATAFIRARAYHARGAGPHAAHFSTALEHRQNLGRRRQAESSIIVNSRTSEASTDRANTHWSQSIVPARLGTVLANRLVRCEQDRAVRESVCDDEAIEWITRPPE